MTKRARPETIEVAPGARRRCLVVAMVLLAALAAVSLFVGVGRLTPALVLSGRLDGPGWVMLLSARIPRTVALVASGAGMAIAGTILQMLTRNRFVDPSTAGTVEAARLGMLLVLLGAPGAAPAAKMAAAALAGLVGTGAFVAFTRRLPSRDVALIPLVGLMFGVVVDAVTIFLAHRADLLQAVLTWNHADFSTVLRGRYEFVWLAAAVSLLAYVVADRFTIAGLGEATATSLGLDWRRAVTIGLIIVAVVTASVVVTVGFVPFVGLVVPNLVSRVFGDNLRLTLPWIALGGAALLLVADLVGRIVVAPFEIPVGSLLGVAGSAFFLFVLMGKRSHGR